MAISKVLGVEWANIASYGGVAKANIANLGGGTTPPSSGPSIIPSQTSYLLGWCFGFWFGFSTKKQTTPKNNT